MSKIFINNALFRVLWPPIFGVVVYFLILLINNSLFLLRENIFTEEVYISIFLSYLVFEVNRLWIIFGQRYFKFSSWGSRVLLLIGGNTLLTLAILSISLYAYFSFVLGYSRFNTELIYFNAIFCIASWLFNLIYISNYPKNKPQIGL